MARLVKLTAIPLYASFARMFGGHDRVPPLLTTPASQFRFVPRTGQFSTIVVAESDDGFIGLGECFGLPHAGATACIINEVLAEVLVGQPLGDPAAMTAPIRKYLLASGHGAGVGMEALSGMDIALWDLVARRQGMPLATLLGGSPGPVPVYVSPVPFLETPEESAAAAAAFLAQGFRAVKLKVGRGIATDVAHAEAVRDVLGKALELRLDVNGAYDPETAVQLADAVRHVEPAWIEEPIPPGDPAVLADVRARSRAPIATGENEFLLDRFETLAKVGGADSLMPNIARVGGVTALVEIANLCARHGVGLSPHGVGTAISISAALHVCRAADAFTIYEANRLPNALRDDLTRTPLELIDGQQLARDVSGHGCDFDRDKAESYRVHLGDREARP